MAEKDRLDGAAYTCSNRRFCTNISKGKPHGVGNAYGSVFTSPLVSGDYTLWLEHVIDKISHKESFWLMWYDPSGSPTIPLSGVISAEQVKEMTSRLAGFIVLDDPSVP